MTPAERVIVHLNGVRATGDGRWLALCPAHEDRSPSLSVKETEDGTVLIHCFAGCGAADVMHTIGLELSDLFTNKPPERGPNRKGQRGISAQEKLQILEPVSWLVLVAAEHVTQGRTLSDDDRQSLTTAIAGLH